MFRTHKRRLLALLAVLALVLVGVAYAAWTTIGTGNASARSSSLEALTIQTSDTVVANLTPNASPTGTLQFTVQGGNNPALTLTDIIQSGPASSSNEGLCPGSTVTVPSLSGLSIPLPANQATTVTVPNAVRMAVSAPTGCQGILFHIPIQVTATT